MTTKRLNKAECVEIANKMTSSISLEIREIDQYFSDLTRSEYEKLVPVEVKTLFEDDRFKSFIETKSSSSIYIGNKRYLYTSFKPVPVSNTNHKDITLKDEKKLVEANMMYDLKLALDKKKRLLCSELEEVLFKLATHKRISEHLPEALPFLPEVKQNELPQINLKEFRNKLNKEIKL